MVLLWEKFTTIMSQLLEDYQELLKLSQDKRQILIDANVEGLTNITKQEEILVLKINKSELARQAIIREIAAAAKKNGQDEADEMVKSISELKKLADKEYAGRIGHIGDKLSDCTRRLKSLSDLNAKLISQHLEFIEFNINVLSSAACEQTYSANPGDSQVKRRPLLNAQA